MPDEFPTLEAALVIGALVALARTLALFSELRQTPSLARALEKALDGGELERARTLCERSKAVTTARFGLALVEALSGGAKLSDRNVARALSRARAGVRRGHARDLVVLAVLVGAGAYAARAEVGAGRVFYALLGIALALTALGALLRQRTLHDLVASSSSVVAAARSSASRPGGRP